jgi:hypothetical protein
VFAVGRSADAGVNFTTATLNLLLLGEFSVRKLRGVDRFRMIVQAFEQVAQALKDSQI